MAQQLPLMDTRSDDQATLERSTRTSRPSRTSRTSRSSRPGQLGRPETGRRSIRTPAPRRVAFAVAGQRSEALLEVPAPDWQIDERTKEVGLAGVAAARRALASAVGRAAA